jgi:hypothetical protein
MYITKLNLSWYVGICLEVSELFLYRSFEYLFPTWDETSQLEYGESGFSRTVPQPIQHDSQWTSYVLRSLGDFSLGLVTFSGLPIHWTLLQQTFFNGGIWKLKFLLTPSLTLTALKMQFIRRLRMLRRTLYIASWQVYLGDGSNALIFMEDISKRFIEDVRLFFLWIQDTDLLNCAQLYLLLCTVNVLSYFQNE